MSMPYSLAAALQCLGPELLGVVEVQPLRHAIDRPFALDAARHQPTFLRQRGMGDAQGHRGRRWRLERQMEARHASRVAIDRERQPRPLDRLARDAVHHDHIHQRVVDLDQRQRLRQLNEPVAGP